MLHLRHCYLQIVISESISEEVLRIGLPRDRHCCLSSPPSNAFTLYMKFLKCPKNFAMSRCCLCSCADPVVIAFSFFFFFLSSLSPSACFLQRGTSARLPSLVKLPQAWQEDLTISSGCVACHNFNRP